MKSLDVFNAVLHHGGTVDQALAAMMHARSKGTARDCPLCEANESMRQDGEATDGFVYCVCSECGEGYFFTEAQA